MSTPREELHALIDSLSDSTAADLLPELRLLKLQAEARAERPQPTGTWPPPWFGSVEGSRPDLSENHEDILRAELGRNSR
ncbi:hypothetical protein [Kribbella sp. NPDC051718]|uniref:hypothetical protein n=1 Tax=Kribbella sp. NPDC051718 TaxID=3155168 RepID=UPI0034213D2F